MDMPVTYYFVFLPCDEGFVCIGEEDKSEFSSLRKHLVGANAEINNLMREVSVKNKELTYLNVLKNQFLGMASHDLRNPIGVISGYTNFLLKNKPDNLSERQINILENIQTSAYFMTNMLNNFLDISQIESGKINLDIRECHLVEQLKKNHQLNEVLAKKKNIQLDFQVQGDVPPIHADANRLEQVFNNLISNAVKYSESGTRVMITLSYQSDHQAALITVKDEGSGISEQA